ncbi:MAG: hypothetical protein KKH98_05255 [Spirochaetes bacterium]|nr:hypothetical protein [Spirochaetota bacterium]
MTKMLFVLPVVLITLAAGYWVLTLAKKEKDALKTIGNIIGYLIVGISLIAILHSAYYAVSSCRYGRYGIKKWSGSRSGCPEMDKKSMESMHKKMMEKKAVK